MGVSHEQEADLLGLYQAAMADPVKRAVLESGRSRPARPVNQEDLAEVDRRIADLLARQ